MSTAPLGDVFGTAPSRDALAEGTLRYLLIILDIFPPSDMPDHVAKLLAERTALAKMLFPADFPPPKPGNRAGRPPGAPNKRKRGNGRATVSPHELRQRIESTDDSN